MDDPGPREASALAPGEIVGRYVVERPLGAGGMGVVSLARDPELRRAVVIKLVHPNMGFGEGGDELEARLRREAQAMAQVSHTNVVQIFDIGRRGDRVFLAMEFVAGQTLGAWLRERRRTGDEILGVIRQAGAGLAAAHRVGLVHRDFKPSNVLVGDDGVVKVTDFGLARAFLPPPGRALHAAAGARVAIRPVAAAQALHAAAGAIRPAVAADPRRGVLDAGATRPMRGGVAGAGERVIPPVDPLVDTADVSLDPSLGPALAVRPTGVHAVLTAAHEVVGTPGFMAPEQAAGEPIDARTDQYALAVVLLDALLGQPVMHRVTAPDDPPAAIDAALARVEVARPVRQTILRGLAVAPDDRFASVDDFLRALAPPAAHARAPARRWLLGVAGIALCAVAAGGWLAMRRAAPGCVPDAPARWTAARADVVKVLGRAHRTFARWDAERIAGAVDGAVATLAVAQRARCEGTAGSDRESGVACVARRSAALDAALIAFSASPPPGDPWAVVATLTSCDGVAVYQRITQLAGQLPGASEADARAIAVTAHELGDDWLVATVQETTALAALAAGNLAIAERDLATMSETGERAGLDEIRGRALLHAIELARVRGDRAAATRSSAALHAIVARHGDAPRDGLDVALVEGRAFTALGDAASAFDAWDRAGRLATQLGDHDAALTAAVGHASATYALRGDLAAARAEADTALASATSASPAARDAAQAVIAHLTAAQTPDPPPRRDPWGPQP